VQNYSIFFYFVLSFYAKRKDERKGAGNANFSKNGRLLHWPKWRYRFS
jgi:hypothetical protein